MIHNHVPELIEILERYAPVMWEFMSEKKTGIKLSEAVLFVADYPNTNYLERLMEYSDPLRAVICVADYGILEKRSVQFSEYRYDIDLRVNIELITADPTLREELGGQMYQFIDRNSWLFKGTKSNWTLQGIEAGGVSSAPDSLFGRVYYLQLKEFS